MEFLEASGILHRWHYGLFHGAAVVRLCYGGTVLCAGLYHDRFCHSAQVDLWRSCVRLGVSGVYYAADRRRAVFLYGNIRTISCKNVHGSEKAPHISSERKNIITICRILTKP